ncbi:MULTISPECIES: GlxA family transcriptional regulator [unclassified Brevundimonas]|uniref:GlxA family transcriptional regulator n=1 Tax=unclassified Brevundimonas TaxID=2622653 RepID=UPI0025BDDE81|nr:MULTISPECIES: GlxA family transcriptional regulator [unclassified Brevundimonas]
MHRVTLLAYEGFQILDATGPAAVFEVAGDFGGAYALTLASSRGGPVRSSSGLVLQTAPLAEVGPGDTLIVPGAESLRAAIEDEVVMSGVRLAAAEGRRVASICSGAFVLAAAGLLDGRRAATHWAAVAELKRRHPKIRVDGESIFVEDDGIWTSAGVTAGIDLALAMVGRDFGDELARKVARRLVVYHRRPGSQSQHSALLEMVTPDNRFAPLLAWARSRLHEPLPVERLADQAALSVRQFTRAFTTSTGVAPARAVERLRVEAARAAIEAGATSLETVALSTGFGGPDRMRRAFVRHTGLPPRACRAQEKGSDLGECSSSGST